MKIVKKKNLKIMESLYQKKNIKNLLIMSYQKIRTITIYIKKWLLPLMKKRKYI